MADRANSIPAPNVHPLSGSSPSGGGAPALEPVSRGTPNARPRPHPRREPPPGLHLHPMGLRDVSDETDIIDRTRHLLRLLKREARLTTLYSDLEMVSGQAARAYHLDRSLRRTVLRIERLTTELAETKAPTLRAAALKADIYIEAAVHGVTGDEASEKLAISISHDVNHLALERACLPTGDGVYAAYHREILAIHDKMGDRETTDAEDEVLKARWDEIDHMALAGRPKTFADAVAALAYASREHRQFSIENGSPDKGARLVQHLIDSAGAVLQRVVQEGAGDGSLKVGESPATPASLAELDFAPTDFGDFKMLSDREWNEAANPNLIAARVAFSIAKMGKAEVINLVAGFEDKHGETFVEDQYDLLVGAEDFFRALADLLETGSTRYMIAAATLAKQRGEIGDEPKPVPAPAPDPRAVAAYREWLYYEGKLLGREMFGLGQNGAEPGFLTNTAASDYHIPNRSGVGWRDLPQPSTRAEAMCRVLGIDWTTADPLDAHFRPIASEVTDTTRAA